MFMSPKSPLLTAIQIQSASAPKTYDPPKWDAQSSPLQVPPENDTTAVPEHPEQSVGHGCADLLELDELELDELELDNDSDELELDELELDELELDELELELDEDPWLELELELEQQQAGSMAI